MENKDTSSSDRMQDILTPGEQRLINCAILCNPEAFNSVKVDYKKLAEFAGFKSSESARVNFGKAKRKLLENVGKGPLPKTASPTKSPSKVTKKIAAKDGGSPTKPRARKTKKAAGATEKPADADETTPVAQTEEGTDANGVKEES